MGAEKGPLAVHLPPTRVNVSRDRSSNILKSSSAEKGGRARFNRLRRRWQIDGGEICSEAARSRWSRFKTVSFGMGGWKHVE